MKISKKLENLYYRDSLTNEKELNYQLGFRGIEVKFTNKVDWLSEFEGEEYLICFEKFLNTCEKLDFYIYDGSSSVICNIAEITVVVNDEQLDIFDNLYKYYKKNYEEIIDNFRREAEKIEADMNKSDKENFEIEKFVFAGKAIFTLESEKTGNRYTYQIKQCENNKKLFFVSLLSGSDNETDYIYIGVIENKKFRLTSKSKLPKNSKPIIAFNFFINKLYKINKIDGLKFYHAGKCGHCGKTLTTPESIKSGFGPICAQSIM